MKRTRIVNCVVNGRARDVPDGSTIDDLARTLTGGVVPTGLAASVDDVEIPRNEWTTTALTDGARLDVVPVVGCG
ncbi:MAG: sulfur carrier protein ThiS [Gordonia sp. (in: high G+C Gram-positive bacteria)]|uniref:sulfur carrier protein ThiS n=1 Tax=Gordonia sp. (in: high G+C Gram-positive bacteria) TaxID=84139 RepID=UPI0039E6E694